MAADLDKEEGCRQKWNQIVSGARGGADDCKAEAGAGAATNGKQN